MKLERMLSLPAALMLSLTLGSVNAIGAVMAETAGPGEAGTAVGTQTAQISNYDWGASVNKTVVSLDRVIISDSVSPEKFSVAERKDAYNSKYAEIKDKGPATHTGTETQRAIVDAYTCDVSGAKTGDNSRYIALEMRCTPSEGSPFYYDLLTGHKNWCDYYMLDISLKDALLYDADGNSISNLRIDSSICLSECSYPDLAGIDLSGVFTTSDGDRMTYASYTPVNADIDNKKPLIIWLHGAGAGGTDPRIPLLGHKTTVLTQNKFQEIMGEAYVLVPQIPDFWMTYNREGDWSDNPGIDSVYLKGLKELIDQYVAGNTGVDENRVIIGGCSNGGYMTMDMILNYPDYFAAAFPICEAYKDTGITDEQLWGIKSLPIWFVFAQNDTTVAPEDYAVPTINRLKAIDGNVHVSVFADVHDTTGLLKNKDGSPHQYSGHNSWQYFFNDQCFDGDMNMWDWLSRQRR